MRRFVMAILVVSGCSPASPSDAIHKAGGKDPIICYQPRGRGYLSACRDANGRFWICDANPPIDCMTPDEPATLFAVPNTQPEKVP